MEARGQLEGVQRDIDTMIYLINHAARSGKPETVQKFTGLLRELIGDVIPLETTPWDEDQARADSRDLLETAMRLKASSTVVPLFPA